MNNGRVVVATGAAGGIGRASAVAFARAGYRVADADIGGSASSVMDYSPTTPDDIARTGELVAETGAEWMSVFFDQRDISAVRDGFAAVGDRFANVPRAAAPLLVRRGGGRVVITSSTRGSTAP